MAAPAPPITNVCQSNFIEGVCLPAGSAAGGAIPPILGPGFQATDTVGTQTAAPPPPTPTG